MTRRLDVTEVVTNFLGLLDDVAAGEQIEIVDGGRVVARLVPPAGPTLRGCMIGVATTNGSDADLFSSGAGWSLS